MSSAFASPAIVPSRVGYFLANVLGGEYEQQLFFYAPLDFSAATGFVANLGNIVQFNSYTNARNALTVGTTPPGETLVTKSFLRDMGKTIHVEVITNGISQRVATLTKAQWYLQPQSETTEGVTGKKTSTTPSAGGNYLTGYVVTWSANPSTDENVGIPVAVTRIGY